jgi:hypothetical protein
MLMAGLWVLDRALSIRPAARAIALGVLTALGCSINVANIMPQLESMHERSAALRSMADLVREKFPADQENVIFADMEPCNLLDVEGGYKLYDLSLFRAGTFNRYKALTEPAKLDEPNGIQHDRAAMYVELLGQKGKDGLITGPKSPAEIDRAAEELIDQAYGCGKRVAFIFRGDPNLSMISHRKDIVLVELGSWAEPPPLPTGLPPWLGALNQPPKPPPHQSASERRAATWHLYELKEIPATPIGQRPSVAGSAAD